MQVSSHQIEAIVRSVLSEMTPVSTKSTNSNMAQAAVLTAARKIEVKSFPIPTVGDDEILVKIEGCGICGTDVHEWKGDPFGLIPVILGHEGTGEIIAMGKNIKKDTSGKGVRLGDRIVTSVITCGECGICTMHPDQPNLCADMGVYGLLPDSEEYHLNGWFASHIILRKGSTFFVVNDLTLDERMLLELASVTVHAYNRAKSTNLLNFRSTVLIQGCGPVGLMMIAVLKAAGHYNIVALDGDNNRLSMSKRLGATTTMNFREIKTLDERIAITNDLTSGMGVDFAFQCTGVPSAAAEVYKYIRRGGGICELGFFVNNGECSINPHFDLCNKEITLVGSWVYGAHEYPITMDFFKQAKQMGLPIEELVTHRYPLDQMNEAMETNLSLKGIKIAFVAE